MHVFHTQPEGLDLGAFRLVAYHMEQASISSVPITASAVQFNAIIVAGEYAYNDKLRRTMYGTLLRTYFHLLGFDVITDVTPTTQPNALEELVARVVSQFHLGSSSIRQFIHVSFGRLQLRRSLTSPPQKRVRLLFDRC